MPSAAGSVAASGRTASECTDRDRTMSEADSDLASRRPSASDRAPSEGGGRPHAPASDCGADGGAEVPPDRGEEAAAAAALFSAEQVGGSGSGGPPSEADYYSARGIVSDLVDSEPRRGALGAAPREGGGEFASLEGSEFPVDASTSVDAFS